MYIHIGNKKTFTYTNLFLIEVKYNVWKVQRYEITKSKGMRFFLKFHVSYENLKHVVLVIKLLKLFITLSNTVVQLAKTWDENLIFHHEIPYATKWLLLFFGSTWSHIYSICSHGDRYCMISPVINLFAKYARNVLHHKLHSIISIYINHEFVIHGHKIL